MLLLCQIAEVVYATAKILILKQITTQLQYQLGVMGCLCYCKDTNFKANHNAMEAECPCGVVVYATAKILILKQITTSDTGGCESPLLFMLPQRY